MSGERRASPRFAVEFPVHYRRSGLRGMGRRGDGLALNISEGGLLIGLASRRMRRGTKLKLELGGSGAFPQLPGIVVRVTEFGFAIRFGTLEPDQREVLKSLVKSAAEEAAGRR